MTKSECKEIIVDLPMHNFDKACEIAYKRAVSLFEIDDCGHCSDDRFPRSSSSINVKFVSNLHSGGMGGQTIIYKFSAWMENYDDEDNDRLIIDRIKEEAQLCSNLSGVH